MNSSYARLLERAINRCEYCHAPTRTFNFPFEVEHITPRSDGGQDGLDNFALACHSCNAFKSTRQIAIDPETNITVRLFHPRLDRWQDHFVTEADSHLLQGKTSIGRATINALQINSSEQQLARSQWMRLNLFP